MAAVSFGIALLPARGQAQDFNILANDDDHGFKPKILFSEANGDRVHVLREDGSVSYEVLTKPGRISACVTGNLVRFPFSEISESMPVGITVGGFSFDATLGDDNSRRVDREGNLLPFDPSKKSAIFYFQVEVPPTTDTGDSTFRRVGYVKFSWTTKTVTARVLVVNVEDAGVAGVYDRGALLDLAAIDADRGGAKVFANEPIDVSLTFGSATGLRTAYGKGRVQTLFRKVGSEAAGNADVLQLDSLLAAGSADVAAPVVATKVPDTDEDGDGLVSFNGTITDLAPSSLSGILFPVALRLTIDGVEMLSDQDVADPASADYNIVVSDPDRTGKCIFTITNLILPGGPARHDLVIETVDGSDNARLTQTKVADKGAQ